MDASRDALEEHPIGRFDLNVSHSWPGFTVLLLCGALWDHWPMEVHVRWSDEAPLVATVSLL